MIQGYSTWKLFLQHIANGPLANVSIFINFYFTRNVPIMIRNPFYLRVMAETAAYEVWHQSANWLKQHYFLLPPKTLIQNLKLSPFPLSRQVAKLGTTQLNKVRQGQKHPPHWPHHPSTSAFMGGHANCYLWSRSAGVVDYRWVVIGMSWGWVLTSVRAHVLSEHKTVGLMAKRDPCVQVCMRLLCATESYTDRENPEISAASNCCFVLFGENGLHFRSCSK